MSIKSKQIKYDFIFIRLITILFNQFFFLLSFILYFLFVSGILKTNYHWLILHLKVEFCFISFRYKRQTINYRDFQHRYPYKWILLIILLNAKVKLENWFHIISFEIHRKIWYFHILLLLVHKWLMQIFLIFHKRL